MKVIRRVKVKNSMGLHTRPATVIVKMLQNCKCNVHFTYKRETVNAKSLLSILMLAAQRNSRITITAEGIDAEVIIEKLSMAFEDEFGERLA
ncbi:MAG: HPr family phosphocarrier protein [Parachlamydiaceae bacterium]|nr:HPr family phosphocarrier protein [Parachlamydiaceae bacterium]